MARKIHRRTLLKGIAGAARRRHTADAMGCAMGRAEPIVIGLPTAQTAAAGVADDLDHLNGTTLAMEEINAAGGILGRQFETICDRR
jgi:branched-chain amino acid transport system substrate-binding protein